MNTAITIAEIEFALREKFEETASWRRRILEEYPTDRHNEEAAIVLDRLADTVAEADEGLLLAYYRLIDTEEDNFFLSELESEFLRDIGFQDTYASADKFLERFIAAAQRRENAA